MTVTLFQDKRTKPKKPSKLRTCTTVDEASGTSPGQAKPTKIEKRRIALSASQKRCLEKSSIRITCQKPRLTARILKGGILCLEADRMLEKDDFWVVYCDHIQRLEAKR